MSRQQSNPNNLPLSKQGIPTLAIEDPASFHAKIQQCTNYTTLKLDLVYHPASLPEIESLRKLRTLYLDSNGLMRCSSLTSVSMLTALDLNCNKLTFCSLAELQHLTKLKQLFISNNNLQNLDSAAFIPLSLRILDLSSNGLERLPTDFSNLTNLTSLDLSQNSFDSTSLVILRLLPSLRTLFLSDNHNNYHYDKQLRVLSSSFYLLESLTEFDLSKNQIQKLPMRFSQLSKLTNLNLSQNQLRTESNLNPLVELTQLGELNLSRNSLSKLPLSFGSLQNLSYLNLSRNNLEDLPSQFSQLINLTDLDLSANKLIAIPIGVLKLSARLKHLKCQGNPLRQLPKELSQFQLLTELRIGRMSDGYQQKEFIQTLLLIADLCNSLTCLKFDKKQTSELYSKIKSIIRTRKSEIASSEKSNLRIKFHDLDHFELHGITTGVIKLNDTVFFTLSGLDGIDGIEVEGHVEFLGGSHILEAKSLSQFKATAANSSLSIISSPEAASADIKLPNIDYKIPGRILAIGLRRHPSRAILYLIPNFYFMLLSKKAVGKLPKLLLNRGSVDIDCSVRVPRREDSITFQWVFQVISNRDYNAKLSLSLSDNPDSRSSKPSGPSSHFDPGSGSNSGSGSGSDSYRTVSTSAGGSGSSSVSVHSPELACPVNRSSASSTASFSSSNHRKRTRDSSSSPVHKRAKIDDDNSDTEQNEDDY